MPEHSPRPITERRRHLRSFLIMGACLTGVANAVRELVKERAIYTRERAAGLSTGAYLSSKLVVLGVISAAQAVILVLIGLAGAVVLGGQALALAFLSSGLAVRAVPGGTAVLGGTILGVATGAVTGPYGLSGRVVTWIVLIAGQLLATWLLAVASRAPLRRVPVHVPPVWLRRACPPGRS